MKIIGNKVRDKIKTPTHDELWNQIDFLLFEQIFSQTDQPIFNQFYDSIFSQVIRKIHNEINGESN